MSGIQMCDGSGYHQQKETYTSNCCLYLSQDYTLHCWDSYGDGWQIAGHAAGHFGFLGSTYCVGNFGSYMTETLTTPCNCVLDNNSVRSEVILNKIFELKKKKKSYHKLTAFLPVSYVISKFCI